MNRTISSPVFSSRAEPTEIAILTEAKENIKESRIFIQRQVSARGFVRIDKSATLLCLVHAQ